MRKLYHSCHKGGALWFHVHCAHSNVNSKITPGFGLLWKRPHAAGSEILKTCLRLPSASLDLLDLQLLRIPW
jgi:hypothetical protein